MMQIRYRHAAAALGTIALLAACGDYDNNDVLGPRPSGADAAFEHYVALGNSITAGMQSAGINDSTQRQSYAFLLARQMKVPFAYPSLAGRGCEPPIVNFLTQQRLGLAVGDNSTVCDLRSATASAILNNVAVPGATVAALTSVDSAANTLTSLFLAGKSQVEKALDADPTFASIWIGNNDVLEAAVSGVLTPFPGVSRGVTPQAAFEAQYNEALTELGAQNIEGLLVGVVQVTAVPILFPVAALLNPAALGGFDQAAGRVPTSGDPYKAMAMTIDANCATAPTTLVSFRLASAIAKFRNDTNPTGQAPKDPALRMQAGGLPPYIACGVSGTPWPAPVGEIGILTTDEQDNLSDAVDAYNLFIKNKAATLGKATGGWGYFDPNVVLDSVSAEIPTFPDLTTGTATFGKWFSLDGVHPSALAHRVIANHMIDVINARYGTSLKQISVP